MDFKPADSAADNSDAKPRFTARFALPILMLGSACLSYSPIAVRLSEVGPIATAANRIGLALPIFVLLMWLRPQDRLPVSTATGRRDAWLLALGGAFFALDLLFWHWSIVMTSVANATVLANMAPVFVVLAAWVLFRDKVSRLFLLGLGTSIAGVIVLMGESLAISSTQFTGVVYGVITSWFYAGYILTVAKVRKRVSTAATMAIGGFVCVIILWGLALWLEGDVWPHTARGWTVSLTLAFVTQVIGQSLIALSLAHVPAGLGSMALLLQPVLASFVAWILFNEVLSPWQVLGGAAVLVGLELARRGSPRKDA